MAQPKRSRMPQHELSRRRLVVDPGAGGRRSRSRQALALALAPVLAAVTIAAVSTSDRVVEAGAATAAQPFYDETTTVADHAAAGGSDAAARLIARVPQAHWVLGSQGLATVGGDVRGYVDRATRAKAVPVLAVYALPARQCGVSYRPGLTTSDQYRALIGKTVAGIAGRPATVVLEPGALASLDCLSAAGRKQRLDLLRYALKTLTASSTTKVYVDAGRAGWQPATTMADRLRSVGAGSRGRGFSLNVGDFATTRSSLAYGERISALLATAGRTPRYVVDTSRNGTGPLPGAGGTVASWCNPKGRALGARPTTRTGAAHADAYLWVKQPGQSDGDCGRGEPAAGRWYPAYAKQLVANAKAAAPAPTASPKPTATPTAKVAAAADRFQQVYRDDFSNGLSTQWWRYGGGSSASGAAFDSSLPTVSDGHLRLYSARQADGSWRASGLGSRVNQTYGRWTVRAKIQKGTGTSLVALLWPSSNQWTREIDFAEENGAPNRDMMSYTLHKNGSIANHGETRIDTSQYHNYTVEWTPESLVFKIDNVTFGSVGSSHDVREPMRLGLQTEPWVKGTNWFHKVDGSTPSRVEMTVDFVIVEKLR